MHFPRDQPVGSQLKEFGHGFQVPKGIARVDVPQIGGQLGEFSFDIEPGAIPVDQGAGAKSMTHVLQPGTVAVPLGRYAEADLLRYFGEGISRHAFCDPSTVLADEKCRNQWCGENAVSDFSVLFQSRQSGSMM